MAFVRKFLVKAACGGRCALVYSFKLQSIMAGKQEGKTHAHTVSGCRKERDAFRFSSLSPFILLGTPGHEMVLPTFRVDILSSVKPFWKHHHRHTQEVCFHGDR